MKFLIDNQLPLSLARFLAAAGNDCQHVLDLGLAQSPDAEIWRYVTERAITLLTKDEDFFHLATRPGATGQVVWVRLGNCRTPALLAAIDKAWPRIQACLQAGDRIVELR